MPMSPDARNDRRREILTLLREHKGPIGSQQEIVDLLQQRGIQATQSSVSRDLAALGVLRVNGKYKVDIYGSLWTSDLTSAMQLIRHAEPSGPYLTVVSTQPASAKVVALMIQKLGWHEVKGIIAEDATIFIATAALSDQKVLLHRIAHFMKEVSLD
jgi:transcriptional regulator of arginine metabolism